MRVNLEKPKTVNEGNDAEKLVEASRAQAASVHQVIESIFDHLTPVVETANDWKLTAITTLARGLALEQIDTVKDKQVYCDLCGYVLAGLRRALCPGCGSQLD